MKLGVRGLAVLVGAAGLAAAGVATPAQAHPVSAAKPTPAKTSASKSAGVRNPYSPAYGHPYRHGVIPTVQGQKKIDAWNAAHPAANATTGPQTLSYGGGVDGIGVQSGHSKVYVIFYGTQWGTSSTDANGNLKFTNDPSGVAGPTQQMFKGIGTNGELWSAELTQWCDGAAVATGATSCPANANFIPYQSGGVLSGAWYDNSGASPGTATATQLANEAIKAAQHFGNTTVASNRYTYYVIVSPHGTNPDSYQGNYCAWHDYTGDYGITGTYKDVAFSNQPYNTDSGAGCGVGFLNSPGTTDGYTMTLGHEWHEMMSDQNPAGGWTNHTGSSYNGQENSDECAWIAGGSPGGAKNVSFGSFGTYAEQASWSNDTNSCAISHPIVTHSAVTVTNPGNKSSTVNVATSLQITATDANGKTLSYSATGLPTGLSISSSTGKISGTPTTIGTYSVKVTAKDTDNATGSASFTWTISDGSCTSQLLKNRGFETVNQTAWSASTNTIFTDGAHPRTGVGYAWLGDWNDGATHTESVSQTVSVKAGCHATLTFYVLINTDETSTTTAYDKLAIKANGTTLKTYSNLNANTAYAKKTIDLSAYAGTSVKLTFYGTADASLGTSFFIDDTGITLS